MTCLIFGTSGQVGLALNSLRQTHTGLTFVQLGRDQADLTAPDEIAQAIVQIRPKVIINAAAYTKVDAAEADEETARLVNAEAPGAMARAARSVGSALIHFSTDYVFSGQSDRPYREDDPVAPQSAYGRTKELGEQLIRRNLERHIILRTSWVFSATGQNFVKTMLKLDRNPIRVVSDQQGNPTPADAIAAAALAMAQAVADGREDGFGTFHFSGQTPTSWFGFAQAIFAEAAAFGHAQPTLEAIPTSAYPTPAKRPAWSVLDNGKIERDWGIAPPDWRVALSRVVADLKS